jgi:hypothetical protein
MSIEAMKQALEALTFLLDEWTPARQAQLKGMEAITAIKQALAAPTVQEPVAQTFGEENVELGFYSDDASNGQQRELVGEVEMGQLVGDGAHKSASNPDAKGEIAVIRGVDEYGPMLDWYEHWVNFPVGTKFYTTPPAAQRQPLTDDEIWKFWWSRPAVDDGDMESQFVAAVRAVLAAHGIGEKK